MRDRINQIKCYAIGLKMANIESRTMKILLLVLSMIFVSSCSEENSVEKANSQPQTPSSLFDTQLEALEKAENVEESLQKVTDARDEEMRKQGI